VCIRWVDSAVHYFRRAEQSHHVKALLALANLYDKGIGVTKSCPQALSYYKRVCESGIWLEEVREGRRLFAEGHSSIAFLVSLLAADEGYSTGQFNAAWLLLTRKIRPQNTHRDELALSLLTRFNSNVPGGDKASFLLTADIHRSGRCKNVSKAAHYYSLASDHGSAVATQRLAALTSIGAGVVQDEDKALLLLRKAFRGLFFETRGLELLLGEAEIISRVLRISIFKMCRKLINGAWLISLGKGIRESQHQDGGILMDE
jgi:TPR repeat protein